LIEASWAKHGEYRQFHDILGKIRSIQHNPGKNNANYTWKTLFRKENQWEQAKTKIWR